MRGGVCVEDSCIVELYWKRDERAIAETERKYGAYCQSIAFRILGDREEAQECVNDTYQGAWESIPPHRPAMLSTYLGKLTRRISLKVLRSRSAQKRGGREAALSLEELSECIPAGTCLEDTVALKELVASLNAFLAALPVAQRRVFVLRYWHALPIADICRQLGYSKSKVESMLHRTREKLKKQLEKEGYFL